MVAPSPAAAAPIGPPLMLLSMEVRCCSAERPSTCRSLAAGRGVSGQPTTWSQAVTAATRVNNPAGRW